MKRKKIIYRITLAIIFLILLWGVVCYVISSLKKIPLIELELAAIALLLPLLAYLIIDLYDLQKRKATMEICRGVGLGRVKDMIDEIKKGRSAEAYGTYFSDDKPPNITLEEKIARAIKRDKISKYVLIYTENEDKNRWANQVKKEIINKKNSSNFIIVPIKPKSPGLNLFVIEDQVYIGFGLYKINGEEKEEIKGGVWIKDQALANDFKNYITDILLKRLDGKSPLKQNVKNN